MKNLSKIALVGMIGLVAAPAARAVPELQIYIEGATYDDSTDTWVYSGSDPLRLWTIGNVDAKGTIYDVKLAIAYADGLTPTFTLTPSTTADFGGFTDPSTPIAAVFSKTVTDDSAPTLGDGSSLPTHSIYGTGTAWTEYKLGDFSLKDSPIGDFMTTLPTPSAGLSAQINVYEISVSGVDTDALFHFDLYDHYIAENSGNYKYINAPFSHDGEGTTDGGGPPQIPEPMSLALFGIGALGMGLVRRRRSA